VQLIQYFHQPSLIEAQLHILHLSPDQALLLGLLLCLQFVPPALLRKHQHLATLCLIGSPIKSFLVQLVLLFLGSCFLHQQRYLPILSDLLAGSLSLLVLGEHLEFQKFMFLASLQHGLLLQRFDLLRFSILKVGHRLSKQLTRIQVFH